MGRICVFGGSITHGKVDPEYNGWVGRFKRYYESKDNVRNAVFNLGIPGDCSEDILRRLKNECDARLNLKLKNENCIIISTGTNDTKSFALDGETYNTIEGFKSNLSQIFEIAKEFSDRIIFMAVTPVDETRMPLVRSGKEIFFNNRTIIAFNRASKEVCDAEGIEHIEVDFNDSLLTEDGIHPNKEGHEIIFQKIKELF